MSGSRTPPSPGTTDVRRTRRRRLRTLRRGGWGVADQGLSSGTNFVLGVLVARATSPRDFGAFALVFAAYTVVLNLGNGMLSDPFLVRFSTDDRQRWRAAAASAGGASLALGLLAAACFLGAAAVTGGAARASLLAFGISLPGLVLQNSWRAFFFAAARPRDAFLNDLAWAAALAGLATAALLVDAQSVLLLVLAWGLSGTLAAAVGCAQARVRPQMALTGSWLSSQRDLAGRYVAESMTLSGSTQATMYGVGFVAGLPAVGALRAAQILLGPVYVLTFGLRAVALPEAARIASRSHAALRRAVALISLGLCVLAAGLGLVVLSLPDPVGRALLGSTWAQAEPVLLPVAVGMVGTAFTMGARIGLRALADARRSLNARLVSAVAAVVLGIAGARYDGATGAAWGLAAGIWLSSARWWQQFWRALDDAPPPDGAAAAQVLADSPEAGGP